MLLYVSYATHENLCGEYHEHEGEAPAALLVEGAPQAPEIEKRISELCTSSIINIGKNTGCSCGKYVPLRIDTVCRKMYFYKLSFDYNKYICLP